MRTRAEIKAIAKERMKANYGVILGGLILGSIIGSAGSIALGIGQFITLPAMIFGMAFMLLNAWRGKAEIGDIFEGFRDLGRSIGGILWMMLFTWLWSLLFVIPGIIKGLAYCMTPYILADTKCAPTQALKLSMRITNGHKGDIFVFYLSFIGWFLLSGLTFGLLYIFYVAPYMSTAMAGLYEELKAKALANGVVSADEMAA